LGRGKIAVKALVTGGGGFLGSAICRRLRDAGHDVTALGRRHYPQLEAEGIPCVQADLRDAVAMRKSCADMDAVFHAGAIPGIWGPRNMFWETNVQGTENVIVACHAAGVQKLIYTSSPSVVFGNTDLCGVNESQPYPDRYLAHYPASKAAAEKLVLFANDATLATVALRPHLIWGPGDPHLIPRIIEKAKKGKLRIVGDGKNLVDIIYIDNAADAHLLAEKALSTGSPAAGKAYFLGQERPVELWAWLNDLLGRLKVPQINNGISYSAAYRLGGVLEGIFALIRSKKEPPMTRFVAAQLAKSHYFDHMAAERDFGYKPSISIQEGVEQTVAYFETR
jgi:nucleoside-diphosphate-sugar epimerase